ncbi:MAG: hypothetical protein AB1760_00320 [Pseudomonadota bacterium]
MAVQVTTFEAADAYVFKAQLDDANPDSEVIEYRFGKEPPKGQTTKKYLASCKREATLLAELEAERRAAPKPLGA